MLTVRLTMHKLQILDTIVGTDTVDVMHTLSGEQWASDVTRHDKAMFEYVPLDSDTLIRCARSLLHVRHSHSKLVGGIGVHVVVPVDVHMSRIASSHTTTHTWEAPSTAGFICGYDPSLPLAGSARVAGPPLRQSARLIAPLVSDLMLHTSIVHPSVLLGPH